MSTGGHCRGQGVVTSRQTGRTLIASNRKARHDYTILKTYEAGIKLLGTEVKSLRAGRVSLVDAFAQEREGEIMLYGLHIAEYSYGTWTNHQPRRTRKLLLHRVEIDRILERVREGGVTLVPLSMYFADGWAKVELALARGKRSWDKRQTLAERDANREIAREMSRHLKGITGRSRRAG
ncbi:SsrA-binding protein SmpB [Planosporangium sp. 12N6]|uniref:SsrA-binding protein SmpB n=1 Tax=Planosporangium spinosum TaxID=3402278 RepID=UPI003CF0CD9A